MEISQVENWDEIDQLIAKIVADLIKINMDTEKDIYGYFQGIRDLQKDFTITCPYCDEKLDPIEVGLNPQKTMANWEQEDRTEDQSMTFEEMREHLNHQTTKQIIHAITAVRTDPTGVEQKLEQMESLVSTLTYISEILADLPKAIEQAKTRKDLLDTMTEALNDIQAAMKKVATKEG